MINYKQNVFRDGNLAVKTIKITVFGFPILSARITSTNSQAVRQLTVTVNQKDNNKIIGFK